MSFTLLPLTVTPPPKVLAEVPSSTSLLMPLRVNVEAPVTFNAPACEIDPLADVAARLPPTVEAPSFRSLMSLTVALPAPALSWTLPVKSLPALLRSMAPALALTITAPAPVACVIAPVCVMLLPVRFKAPLPSDKVPRVSAPPAALRVTLPAPELVTLTAPVKLLPAPPRFTWPAPALTLVVPPTTRAPAVCWMPVLVAASVRLPVAVRSLLMFRPFVALRLRSLALKAPPMAMEPPDKLRLPAPVLRAPSVSVPPPAARLTFWLTPVRFRVLRLRPPAALTLTPRAAVIKALLTAESLVKSICPPPPVPWAVRFSVPMVPLKLFTLILPLPVLPADAVKLPLPAPMRTLAAPALPRIWVPANRSKEVPRQSVPLSTTSSPVVALSLTLPAKTCAMLRVPPAVMSIAPPFRFRVP
ncbi:hypothetical protein D9M73_70280 [compost metagenome]